MKRSIVILLHTGYWMIYLLLLAMLLLLMWAGKTPRIQDIAWSQLILFMGGFAILPALIGFYSFYTFLFSGLLRKKEILLFSIAAAGIAVLAGLIGAIAVSGLSTFAKTPGLFASGYESATAITGLMAFNALLNGGMGLVMRGFISWYGDIRLKEDLNRKNFETELALVRSQLNPHFLFNTINNIDVLIGKDPAMASAYLNKLSDIMRFMLYESKTENVPLTKELAYIEKYIELQQIRTANKNYVYYHVEGSLAGHRVAPMLFIPFIENAFKHAMPNKEDNVIDIRISTTETALHFYCANQYAQGRQQELDNNGLGNELIRKRLQLLYPDRHRLEISDEAQTYTVTLMIDQHAH